MKTVTINRLDKYVDKEIEIKGWVYNRRSVGKIWFLILRDGTGLLQCVVVDGECDKDTFNLEQKLNQEDSVIVKGKVKKEPRAIGGYELGVSEVYVINHTTEVYPISNVNFHYLQASN